MAWSDVTRQVKFIVVLFCDFILIAFWLLMCQFTNSTTCSNACHEGFEKLKVFGNLVMLCMTVVSFLAIKATNLGDRN